MIWDSITKGTCTIHRARINGETVAAIFREGDAARIVAGHLNVDVLGDTLDQNKQTARDMLGAPRRDRLDVFRAFANQLDMKGQ